MELMAGACGHSGGARHVRPRLQPAGTQQPPTLSTHSRTTHLVIIVCQQVEEHEDSDDSEEDDHATLFRCGGHFRGETSVEISGVISGSISGAYFWGLGGFRSPDAMHSSGVHGTYWSFWGANHAHI